MKTSILNQLFLNNFHNCTPTQKTQEINRLINQGDLTLIVELHELDSVFSDTCRLSVFNDKWIAAWSTYGVIITCNVDKALYEQPGANDKFELFIGIHYYYQALVTARQFKKNYSSTEIQYLEKAIKYKSVHGCQHYHSYLYSQIDNSQYEYGNELFSKIIRQIKPLLTIYGCYAYVMLTEAYVRYGQFLKISGLKDKADAAFSAALEACQQAKKTFQFNSVSTYNASFGKTLAESNSLGLSNIEDILMLTQLVCDGKLGKEFFNKLNEVSSPPPAFNY